MDNLNKIDLFDFDLEVGKRIKYLPLFYQTFGQQLGSAPAVLVNHALTGNSQVTGEKGWWKELIGDDRRRNRGKKLAVLRRNSRLANAILVRDDGVAQFRLSTG